MSAAEYTEFQQRVAAGVAPVPFSFLPRPDQDFRTAFPIDGGLGAEAQRSLDAINLHSFGRSWKAFDKEQELIAAIRSKLIVSISSEASFSAGHATDGFAGMSIQAIFVAMAARFGLLTADEMASLDATLDHKWTSGSITSHIASHVNAHEVLRANGAPISVIAKIQRLTLSLSSIEVADHSHPFHVQVMTYRDSHPDLHLQVFAEFAQIIERAGFSISPTVSSTAISAARSKTAVKSKSEAARRRDFFADKPQVHCSFHGDNDSHDSAHCRVLMAKKAAGGGRSN